jgi:hypothetical protein
MLFAMTKGLTLIALVFACKHSSNSDAGLTIEASARPSAAPTASEIWTFHDGDDPLDSGTPSYRARTMIKDYDENALRADSRYKTGKDVVVAGYVVSVDQNGKEMAVHVRGEEVTLLSIACMVPDFKSTRAEVLKLNKDEPVIVIGKVTERTPLAVVMTGCVAQKLEPH